jgi:hypothetical protein
MAVDDRRRLPPRTLASPSLPTRVDDLVETRQPTKHHQRAIVMVFDPAGLPPAERNSRVIMLIWEAPPPLS